jgi:hypothetical protein
MDQPSQDITWANLSFLHAALPDCASPVVSVNDVVPEFQGIHGTGFFARRDRHLMFITARHCLGRTLTEVEGCVGLLRIPYTMDGLKSSEADFVPFDSVFHLPHTHEDIPGEFIDVAVLPIEVTPGSPEEQSLWQRAVLLPPTGNWLNEFQRAMIQLDGLTHGIRLIACGYPLDGTQTEIDSEGTVANQQVIIAGSLQAGILPDSMTMADITWDRDMGGFSGSPVFLAFVDEQGPHYALVGVLTRAGNQRGQFIRVGEFINPYFAYLASH